MTNLYISKKQKKKLQKNIYNSSAKSSGHLLSCGTNSFDIFQKGLWSYWMTTTCEISKKPSMNLSFIFEREISSFFYQQSLPNWTFHL